MDQTLLSYLDNLGIKYKPYTHPAVFTVAESKKLKQNVPGLHTKSLFLKDENNKFYLICMPGEKRLNIKQLEKELALKKLTFASSEELKEHLNLIPGSVSIFGMIYVKDVILIVDKQLWRAEKVGFHPNVNTATLEISHEGLEKFCNSLNAEKHILELENE